MSDEESEDRQLWEMFVRWPPDRTPDPLAPTSPYIASDSHDSLDSIYPSGPGLEGCSNPVFDPELQVLGWRYTADSDLSMCAGPMSPVSVSTTFSTENSSTVSPSFELTYPDDAMRP